MCTISTVHTIPTESTHLAMLKDINYVFSNPSHYPLNFTTRAIPFGNASMVKIMILFYTNVNSGWGLSETTNRPTTLTYEWLSIDSTSFTMYIDGVASHFRSMTNNNRASNITEIGIRVGESVLSASTGVMFDFVSLPFVINYTNSPSRTPTQHPLVPTQYPSFSSSNPTQYPLVSTVAPTHNIITLKPEHVNTTKANNEAEVEEQSTRMTLRTTISNKPEATADNNLVWIIAVIVSSVLCVCILVVLIKLMNDKRRKQKESETNLVIMNQPQLPPSSALDVMKTDAWKSNNDEDGQSPKHDVLLNSITGSTQGEQNEAQVQKDQVEKDMIRNWLETKVQCGEYLMNFIDNGYDRMDIICEIKDVSSLEEIGIESMEHQLIIIRQIYELKKEKSSGATKCDVAEQGYYEQNVDSTGSLR
eukprot:287548_1